MTSKLTETFELRLQSFKRELVQEEGSYMKSAVKKFKLDPYIFKAMATKAISTVGKVDGELDGS